MQPACKLHYIVGYCTEVYVISRSIVTRNVVELACEVLARGNAALYPHTFILRNFIFISLFRAYTTRQVDGIYAGILNVEWPSIKPAEKSVVVSFILRRFSRFPGTISEFLGGKSNKRGTVSCIRFGCVPLKHGRSR